MPFIQAREDITADISGRSPAIALVIAVASVLRVEQLSPSMGNDLPIFMQRFKAKPAVIPREPAWP